MPIPIFFNPIRIYNSLIFTLLYSLQSLPHSFLSRLSPWFIIIISPLPPPPSLCTPQKSSTWLQATFYPLCASTMLFNTACEHTTMPISLKIKWIPSVPSSHTIISLGHSSPTLNSFLLLKSSTLPFPYLIDDFLPSSLRKWKPSAENFHHHTSH